MRGSAGVRAARIGILLGLAALTTHAEPASTIHPNFWPEAHPPKLHDAALEARIDALLAQLTVEEKVAQIIIADTGSATPEDVRRYHLGGAHIFIVAWPVYDLLFLYIQIPFTRLIEELDGIG